MKSMVGAEINTSAQKGKREGRHGYKLPKDSLTPREAGVCQLLLEGLAVKEAAGRLCISAKTAGHHTRSLYEKLGIHSRAELFKRFSNDPVVEIRASPRDSGLLQILKRLDLMEQTLSDIARDVAPAQVPSNPFEGRYIAKMRLPTKLHQD
jgi:DNA-binding CsgD family transcriptional regulator